jgi:hypothetical protein
LLRRASIKSIADAERRNSGHSGSRSGRHIGLLRCSLSKGLILVSIFIVEPWLP